MSGPNVRAQPATVVSCARLDSTATREHPRGQVMADTLVERVAGRAAPSARPAANDQDASDKPERSTTTGKPKLRINLLMPLDHASASADDDSG